jgi:lysozyme family protein
MIGNFTRALALVLRSEGGFVNNPKDPGGATNRGVTQAVYDAFRKLSGKPVQSVRLITDAEVSTIYKRQYWDAVAGDALPAGVDYATFDYAVNSGVARAAQALQSAVGVVPDGHIGLRTIAAVKDAGHVIDGVCNGRLLFLRHLSTFADFGRGWTTRVAEVRAAAEGMLA